MRRQGRYSWADMSDRLTRILAGLANSPAAAPLLALAIGGYLIGGRSFATDEAFSWGLVALPDPTTTWAGIKFTSGNMLAYFGVLKLFVSVDDSVVWLRLPSLIFGVTTVALIYRIGERWFDRRTAQFAGLLSATSVPLLYYAVEVRSYAMVALMSATSWFLLDRALRTDRRAGWLLLGVSAGLLVSAHIINVLALPWIAIVAFLGRGERSYLDIVIRLAPIGVAVLPAVGLVLLGDGAQTDWIPPLGPTSVARGGRLLLGDHGQFTSDLTGFVIVGAFLVLYALAFVEFVRSRPRRDSAQVMLWLWFLGLPFLIVSLSLVQPYLWHRYLIASLPAGILIAARFLARIDRGALGAAALLALALLGVVRSVALRDHSADEFEDLAAFFEQNAEATDSLVTARPWTRVGLDYYWRDGAPLRGDPAFGPDYDYGSAFRGLDWVERTSRVWLMDRADSGQVWVDQQRSESDFGFENIEGFLDDDYVLLETYDIQRFRVRLYSPRSRG